MTRSVNFFDSRALHWRARLQISVDVMRELSEYTDPRAMYQVFTRRMGLLFPTTRQITLSRRGVTPPQVRVTRYNLWQEAAPTSNGLKRFPILTGGLFSELLYADEPRLLDEIDLLPSDPAAEFLDGQRSLLAIPIFENGAARHVVVLTREQAAAFDPDQIPELVWMTNLFGRATQTLVLTQALQSLYDDAAAELQAIAELQHSLLPKEIPQVPGLDLATHYSTAQRAGGDYYDFFPQADGALGVLIADVSGHGAPAAVMMAITHSIAHAADAPTADAGAFLAYLNRNLADRYSQENGSFVTAFYALVNRRERRLRYASAGHVPPRLLKPNGMVLSLNRVQRLPLVIHQLDQSYPTHETAFEEGDVCLLYTDGVTDAVNARGSVYGAARLHHRLQDTMASSREILVNVLADLERFTNAMPQTDDRTLVVIRCDKLG